MNKKTKNKGIFRYSIICLSGKRVKGGRKKEGRKSFFLDILFLWDILRDGEPAAVSGPPDKFIQLRLLWRMRDPAHNRVGHAFLFAEQGNPVRNRNTTGELIELSIRAVSMERSFFCESRSLIGKGPVGKAKRARGWNPSEHMSQKTYKKKDSCLVGGSFRCLLKMRRVCRCLCHKQKRMQQSIRFFV